LTVSTFDVPPPDPRVYTILQAAGFSDDLFNPRQHRACMLMERYAVAVAADVAARLGVSDALESPVDTEGLMARLGFVPTFRAALEWLLDLLVAHGMLARDAGRYRRRTTGRSEPRDGLRAAILATDETYAPALALLDEAAALYPRVARGETNGERALFLRASLWVAYFNNTNAYYALNNRVAARAVAGRFAGGRVLEVGAGLGSATQALLELLAARGTLPRLDGYHASEPVVFFRRRAERTVVGAYPTVRFTFSGLDLNQPWATQDIEPAHAEIIWGVNVFHLARDLAATLAEARAALAPGGWLVVGEGMRPGPKERVGAELPFQLLESFTSVELEPTVRPLPGFLTAEGWQRAFERAGFADVGFVPDAPRLREFYPGFLAAAVCGRRPGDRTPRPTR